MALMQIKLSEWIMEIALYIAYIFVVIAPPFIYIWTPIETSKYLHKQYDRNWNSGYITDIKLASASNCESGNELLTLGYWSGVNAKSCLCKNKQNEKIQFATDDYNYCNKGDIKLLYNCIEIPYAEPIKLTKYKNVEFCVKRDTHIMDDMNTYLKNGKDKIKRSDYENHFSQLLNQKVSISNAIIDIVISKQDSLTGYPNSSNMGNGYFLHLKKQEEETSNVYGYNDLITDIHLSNELSCSYNEMSNFNPLNPETAIDYINYGGNKYCETFNSSLLSITKTDLFYNDNNKRTVVINKESITETTLLLNDIYSGTPVASYYSTNNIVYNKHVFANSNQLPLLVYQRYFYGLGCPMMKSMKWHLLQYDNMLLCKNLMIAIAFFTIAAFVMGIVFLIIKLFNNLKGFPCTYCFLGFLFMFMICISLILIITYISLMALSIDYFESFSLYCQIDYSGISGDDVFKTNPMELRFIKDMKYALSLAIGLLVIIVITIIIHTGYYFIVCKDHSPFFELNNGCDTNNNQIEMKIMK